MSLQARSPGPTPQPHASLEEYSKSMRVFLRSGWAPRVVPDRSKFTTTTPSPGPLIGTTRVPKGIYPIATPPRSCGRIKNKDTLPQPPPTSQNLRLAHLGALRHATRAPCCSSSKVRV